MADADLQWRKWTEPVPAPAESNYKAAVLADAPTAYYRLGEAAAAATMLDASGNARNGSYVGGPTLGVPGLLPHDADTAADLAGTGQYGSVPYAAWMTPATWAMDAIIKPDKVNGNGGGAIKPGVIAGRHHSTQYQLWHLEISDGKLKFVGRTGSSNTLVYEIVSTTTLVAGQTYHVAASWDGSYRRLYVNGVLEATDTNAPGAPPTIALGIGSLSSGYGSWWYDGVLDEVAFYATALPDARVAAHNAARTQPTPGADPGGWVVDLDRTAALSSWTIDYGRRRHTEKTQPLQATVSLAADLAGACPVIGERFRLTLSDASAAALGITADTAVRFTGEVTDPVDDTARGLYTITGVGRLGRGSRRPLDPSWPAELDGARVARILAAAGVTAGAVDPGTVKVLPAVTPGRAGQLLDVVTDSAAGQVVEQPAGVVDWHDSDHRRGTAVTVTLTAAEILNDITWEQHVDDVLNDLDVTWGDGQTVRATDPTSIAARESFPGSLATILTTADDAHSRGSLEIARRADPVWQLPALVLDLLRVLSTAKRAQVLALRHGARIQIAGLPAGGPYAGTVEFFVEGHTERAIGRGSGLPPVWRLGLAVSDPKLSGVSLRWTDVDPARTWSAAAPAVRWLDVALIENPANL